MANLIPVAEQIAQAGMAMAVDNVRKRARDMASEFQEDPRKFHDAANKIISAFRKRKAKKAVRGAGRIGMPMGSSGSKKDVQLTTARTAYDGATLNYVRLTDIPRSTTDEINARTRSSCFFSGVSWKCHMFNDEKRPNKIHFAVVSMVRGKDPTSIGDGFFRSYSTSRDVNFGTTLDPIQYDYPINTDKLIVHARWSYTLAPLQDYNLGQTEEVGPQSYRQAKRWLPVKRNLRFNDDSDDDCETPVFLVWWAKSISNSPGLEGTSYYLSMDVVSYFHESIATKRSFRR